MIKLIKTLLVACLSASTFFAQAQTFNFNSPQGNAAGVTGGGLGPIITVTTRTEFENALKTKGSYRILIQGSIQVDYISATVNDKTILGLPGSKLFTNVQSLKLSGILNLSNSSNVIIRNVTFVGPGAYDADGRDCLTLDGSTRIWVDHCDFQDGMDGNYDHKGKTDNVTVSWCRFRYLKAPKSGGPGGANDHRFSNLVGSDAKDKPTDGRYSITWQYCWWDNGCVERMTRARNATLHFLNCYWNTNTGKVLLGLEGVDAYVENSTFAGSGTKYSSYGGTNNLTCVGSTSPPANVGTCPAPSYSHETITAAQSVTAITGNCGAGATLEITAAGVISAGCGSSAGPTLSVNGVESQSVYIGSTFSTIVYTWGGTATDVTVTGLPAGLTGTKNAAAKTYTISGTPTASSVYTITTVQPEANPVISSGNVRLLLPTPGNVSATSTPNSVTLNWGVVSGATGYTLSFCKPYTGPAPKKVWNFTGPWTIDGADADANLVVDTDPSRLNYVPATTLAPLKFANGTAIPDVDGLLFTQAGVTKIRLGFGSGQLFLNGPGIVTAIPCTTGDKIYVVAVAGNAASIDRGFSVAGGTLNTAESSSFINSSGTLTQAGAVGYWVYNATSSQLKITTTTGSTGGMNVYRIGIGATGESITCSEVKIAGGSTTTYTATNLTPNTEYSYVIRATNATPAQASDYTDSATIYTAFPLGIEDQDISYNQSTLYPNPSADAFYVKGIAGSATVTVSDLSGKVVMIKEITGDESIAVEALPQGLYHVKIAGANGSKEHKLIKR